jgi:hypothetical protein
MIGLGTRTPVPSSCPGSFALSSDDVISLDPTVASSSNAPPAEATLPTALTWCPFRRPVRRRGHHGGRGAAEHRSIYAIPSPGSEPCCSKHLRGSRHDRRAGKADERGSSLHPRKTPLVRTRLRESTAAPIRFSCLNLRIPIASRVGGRPRVATVAQGHHVQDYQRDQTKNQPFETAHCQTPSHHNPHTIAIHRPVPSRSRVHHASYVPTPHRPFHVFAPRP